MKRKSGKTRRPPSDLPAKGGSYIRQPDGSLSPNPSEPSARAKPAPLKAVESESATAPAKSAK